MFGAGNLGATHGSPYDYDTHVPLMLWGPRWVGAAALSARVGIVDLAPTLARFLKVASPADSEGRPLPLLDP
jgi:arylsulfatase A-like enzyme